MKLSSHIELHVSVLPNHILQVSWKSANDAKRSLIDYIINATMTGLDFSISTSVEHPITMTTLTGLPQYSAGTVSVWAKNPGGLSEPVSLRFRMVDIVTNGRHGNVHCNIKSIQAIIFYYRSSILK